MAAAAPYITVTFSTGSSVTSVQHTPILSHTLMGSPAEIAHGYMLIGLLLNMFLYGILTTQVYLYYINYKSDKLWIKLLVSFLYLLDTLDSFFGCFYLYTALIVHFDDPPFLARATWVFSTDPILTGIIASLVQLFFGWRIRTLTGRNWLFSLVIVCAFVGGVGAIVTTIEVLETPNFVDFRNFKAVVILWLVSECLGDIIITTILVIYLNNHKTGFSASDQLVDRIIRLTVQTGLSTSLCAFFDLLFFLLYPNGLHLLFNFPLSKLYTNSLLSTLNSRRSWNLAADHHRTDSSVTFNELSSTQIRRLSKPTSTLTGGPQSLAHSSSVEGALNGSHRGPIFPQTQVFVSVESNQHHDIAPPRMAQTASRRAASLTSANARHDQARSGPDSGDIGTPAPRVSNPAVDERWNLGQGTMDWGDVFGNEGGSMIRQKSARDAV
ncbi:hypothetical protein HGRIS_006287 [Hohenbuehelia grisea]|uniref:DUF6534 domain-containing protein n=1 Tax=Hohenbuehelia grisea TaxID=104357 RepID=A0ABR3K1Y1_9AGAR